MLLLRRLISLPLVIFALPAAGFLTAGLVAEPGFRIHLLGMIALDGRKGGDVLMALSAASILLGLSLVAAIYLGAAICGSHRRRLASVFGPLVRGVSLGVAILALLQMSVMVIAVVLFLVGTVHFLPLGFVIALVVGAFYTAEELARAALGLSEPAGTAVNGLAVSADAQPLLWAKLHEVASSIGARAPDNLVLGFAPAFFATGGKVHLPDKTVVTGETLYLSVTSMRLLSQPQLQAVIGHELSHFAGDDTSFSLRFMPIYQRLFDSMMASHAVRGYASLTAIPSRVILREAFLSFARAERRISRAREIAADRAGAVAASASDMITAIQLVEHSTRLWPLVVQESIDAINTGATPPILGERLESLASTQSAASHDANQSPTGQLSDTHPTLAARAQALGVQVCSAGPQACPQDIPRATALIDRADELEAALGCLLRNALLASGAARPPRDPDRPNYLERKRLQRIRQAEARKRRAEAVAVEQQV